MKRNQSFSMGKLAAAVLALAIVFYALAMQLGATQVTQAVDGAVSSALDVAR